MAFAAWRPHECRPPVLQGEGGDAVGGGLGLVPTHPASVEAAVYDDVVFFFATRRAGTMLYYAQFKRRSETTCRP